VSIASIAYKNKHCRQHDKRSVPVSGLFFQYLLIVSVLYRPNSETTPDNDPSYRLRNNDIGAALGIQVEDVFTQTGGCGCDLMGLTAST
jgi:hypothetical protein